MSDARFEFGANWTRFLETVDETRIAAAVHSLQGMFDVDSLTGQRFLDVGSGSGLFSLAAHRLGAEVHSFDYDPQSVACTQEMKRRFGSDSGPPWMIEEGSALDEEYLSRLEPADVVYSWGVLHHTGDMLRAIDLVSRTSAENGRVWLAIYNDQGPITERWIGVKRLYQRLPRFLRPVLVVLVGGILFLHRVCRALASSLVALLTGANPFRPLQRFSYAAQRPDPRGMNRWHDLVDWVGGWPFEVAKPEEVMDFLHERGFVLEKLKTCGGGMGCNEFLFRRAPVTHPSDGLSKLSRQLDP